MGAAFENLREKAVAYLKIAKPQFFVLQIRSLKQLIL
jgi:hypothetical protein